MTLDLSDKNHNKTYYSCCFGLSRIENIDRVGRVANIDKKIWIKIYLKQVKRRSTINCFIDYFISSLIADVDFNEADDCIIVMEI